MQANFHTHTIFCDGQNKAEDYVLAAIAKGMPAIGFSTHVPIPIENKWNMCAAKTKDYFVEIAHLKHKYTNLIEIYTGFEMDYLITADRNSLNEYISRADYTIGSVHYVYAIKNSKYYSVDGSVADVATTFQEFANSDNKLLVSSYYHELLRIIREFKPDILGHLDIIKKRNHNNIYFDEKEKWYIDLVLRILDEVANAGIIIEVNTGGRSRGFISDNYPSEWVLKECLLREIPIVIASDAHKIEDIDSFFIETTNRLKTLGFTKQKTLKANKWVDIEL